MLSYPPGNILPHSSNILEVFSSTLVRALDNLISPLVSVTIGAKEQATLTVTVSVLCTNVCIFRWLLVIMQGRAIALLKSFGMYFLDEARIVQISGTQNFSWISCNALLSG